MIKERAKYYKILITNLFILAIMFPFALNSLHYIIFEHNHEHDHHHELSITENNQTHSNCLWDFSIGDFNDNEIELSQQSFTYINAVEVNNHSYKTKLLRFYALRAPPIFI